MASLKGVTLTLLVGPVAVQPAPVAVVEAIESVQVTTAVGQRSGFQVSFVYAKTSPIARTLLPAGYFDPLVRVIMVATLNGIATVLSDGPIKRQDVVASAKPGESKLTITGEDVTGYMDLVQLDGLPYPGLAPNARVAIMMARYAAFGVVPMTVPEPFPSVEQAAEKYAHQQGTDFQYADKLAKDAGYAFYATPGPFPGTNAVYWGPEIRVGLPQPALTVDMDHASNIESLSFSADGNAAELPYAHVRVAGFPVPVPAPNVGLLKPPLSARPLVPTHVKPRETERLPLPGVLGALLAGRGGVDPVTASGTIDVSRYGQPLVARSLVGVRGAGLAYDGLFYVRSVTHTLGRGSWKQSFQLSRDGMVSNLPVLPT